MSAAAFVIAIALVAIAFSIGVLSNWLSSVMPKIQPRYLVAGTLIFALIAVFIGFAQKGTQMAASGTVPQSDGARSDDLSSIAPGLVNRILLLTDDSSGSPVLFAERLNGTGRERLADFGGPVVVLAGSTNLLVSWPDGATQGLQIRTDTGQLVRKLTRPPIGFSDDSPALASSAGIVYFIRSKVKDLGDNTTTFIHPQLMHVLLDGSTPATPVRTSAPLWSVSSDTSGNLLAGKCSVSDPGNVGQACTVDPRTGRLHHIPGSEDSTVSDVAVSPGGAMVAYSSFTATPYGRSQVFVYEIQKNSTTDLSRLPGQNDEPSWAPSSTQPCLAFRHDPTGQDPEIYIGCLSPKSETALAIEVGSSPAWLA
jgi:hypothetical protein